jgi:hypothetical protein
MKIPLKIGWCLQRGVILSKYNLVKRNWHRSTKCVCCHNQETIKHLFPIVNYLDILSIIQLAYSLYLTCSVAKIFGNWLYCVDHMLRFHIHVGVFTVIWSLWEKTSFFMREVLRMQVIYWCTSLLHSWSNIHRVENKS